MKQLTFFLIFSFIGLKLFAQCTGAYLSINSENYYSPSCYGGTDGAFEITVYDGTPPFNVEVSTSDDFSNLLPTDDTQSSQIWVYNLPAGYYYYRVKDANGCESNINARWIEEAAQISIGDFIVDRVYCNAQSVKIVGGVSGGFGSYTYSWYDESGSGNNIQNSNSDNPIIEFPNNSSWGSSELITVRVEDTKGCTATKSKIFYPKDYKFNIASKVEDAICEGDNNGQITLAFESVLNNSSTFDTRWFNESGDLISEQLGRENSGYLVGRKIGKYTAVISEKNSEYASIGIFGCTISNEFEIKQKSTLPEIELGEDISLCKRECKKIIAPFLDDVTYKWYKKTYESNTREEIATAEHLIDNTHSELLWQELSSSENVICVKGKSQVNFISVFEDYKLIVTDSYGCSKEDVVRVYHNNCDPEIEQKNCCNENDNGRINSESIFPNPSSDKITINLPQDVNVNLITINDLIIGTSLIQKHINFNEQSVLIDISSLATGTYLVKLYSNNTEIQSSLIYKK